MNERKKREAINSDLQFTNCNNSSNFSLRKIMQFFDDASLNLFTNLSFLAKNISFAKIKRI
jgi:hypothetical protein